MYISSMNNELFKGTMGLVIINLLKEYGDMYGYQITKQVAELSDGEISIKEGSLYPALHKLENEKLISSYLENVGGRKRKYYRLTTRGLSESEERVSEFSRFVTVINQVLQPKPM